MESMWSLRGIIYGEVPNITKWPGGACENRCIRNHGRRDLRKKTGLFGEF